MRAREVHGIALGRGDEAADLLKSLGGLSNRELSDVFTAWNEGELQSFLIEITARIFRTADPDGSGDLIDKVLENTEDVGRAFPEEARKIHYREAPERHIRGTASTKEVEALREEGIEVVALPVPPHRMSRTH